jgi:CRP/FNR family transcriptional regulator, cyclic AMP receptor protein
VTRDVDVEERLGEARLFSSLSRNDLQLVIERGVCRSFGQRESIFHQGDAGEGLFVVLDGSIKIYVTSPVGTELVLATLGPGETFGELAVIDGGPRTASAKTLTPASLFYLSRSSFIELLRGNQNMAEIVLDSLGGLLRRILEQTSDLVFLDLPGRVAKLLVSLARERGRSEAAGISLDLQMSQGNLAAMVGGSRPTVNQILRSFESRGYIEMRGRELVIRNIDSLRHRAYL